jgi:hypothetical protein
MNKRVAGAPPSDLHPFKFFQNRPITEFLAALIPQCSKKATIGINNAEDGPKEKGGPDPIPSFALSIRIEDFSTTPAIAKNSNSASL